MIIQKFGGSNFISKEVFDNFYNILKNTESKSIIVISALGKTTRRLLESAKQAENGHLTEALTICDKLSTFTLSLVEMVIGNEDIRKSSIAEVNSYFEQIGKYLKNISIIRELTPRVQDALLSFGERIALLVFANFCEAKGLNIIAIDAGEIILTDEEFKSANPLNEKIKENIQEKIIPILSSGKMILTQGFIGKTSKGDYSTMGFESSNLTALILAENLSAKEITIWTDVEGVYNIDPNIWQKAEQLSELSFLEAKKAAHFGNKLIYPKMIDAAANLNMEIKYRSIHNPDGKSTRIFATSGIKNKMITIAEDIYYLKMNLTSLDEISAQIFRKLMTKNDSFKFVSRLNDIAEIFTNDSEIEILLLNNEILAPKYFCLTLINENILNLYKLIGNYSDLFLNVDYRLYPIEESTFLLFLRIENNRDLANILNVIL